MDIRQLLSTEERWKRDMKSAMPQWVNDIAPCRVAKTKVGAQLTFVCRCSVTPDTPQGKAAQVPVRLPKNTIMPQQAQLLKHTLVSKHGQGTCYEIPAAIAPELMQQTVNKAVAAVKRKQEVVVDLEQQLAAHKALGLPEQDELKRRRQNHTKSTKKRAVEINDDNQTPFRHPQNKKNAIDHPEHSVLAALRHQSGGSQEKAKVQLLHAIKELNLQ